MYYKQCVFWQFSWTAFLALVRDRPAPPFRLERTRSKTVDVLLMAEGAQPWYPLSSVPCPLPPPTYVMVMFSCDRPIRSRERKPVWRSYSATS